MANTIRLGTIQGRHAMPVDEYLVEAVEPGQAAYDAVYAAASHRFQDLGDDGVSEVHLYFSGLTEATLAAVDAYEPEDHAFRLILMRYDAPSGEYQPLRRFAPPKPAAIPTVVPDVIPAGYHVNQGTLVKDDCGPSFHGRYADRGW